MSKRQPSSVEDIAQSGEPSQIDFVIITPLAEERDAVLSALGEYVRVPPTPEDVRVYYSAEVPVTFADQSSGVYRVIVTDLLGMGRVEGANAAGDAIRRWRPRYILLVGIAGGLAKAGVSLGDVLISDQVVDYELQKRTVEQTLIRWSVHRTDPRLLAAVHQIQATEWRPLIQHVRPLDGVPNSHIGPICTGDKVVADNLMEQYREIWTKLIGVEMEAGGVASAIFQSTTAPGFLMIRGTSDMADAKKDASATRSWRAYACDVAAAYTLALLRSGPVPLTVPGFPKSSIATAEPKSNVPERPRSRKQWYRFIGMCTAVSATAFFGARTWGPIGAMCCPLPLLLLASFRQLPSWSTLSRASRLRTLGAAIVYLGSALYFLGPTETSSSFAILINQSSRTFLLGSDPLAFNACLAFGVLFAVLSLVHVRELRAITPPVTTPALPKVPTTYSDFATSLKRYCAALVAELDRYDREVNWSDHDLAPLEAEVETERGIGARQRIATDLISAIKHDKQSSVFVVLGDPGSGKSVSLRRLVRELCAQSVDTGIVPIYVNLREFPVTESITTDTLVAFSHSVAFRTTGRDGKAFLSAYYEAFRKNGQLFYILDSFDELPEILDCDERSDAHKRISASLDRFCTQEIQSCRTVIASRHFRSPVGVRGTRLLVRPFTERQLRQAMQSWLLARGINANRYVRRLFAERPHLIPLLRNPFCAELIADYASSAGDGSLPDTAYQVFDQYLSKRLDVDRVELLRFGVTPADVRGGARILAHAMYSTPNMGLEADLAFAESTLHPEFGDRSVGVIEALRYSRLVRVGGHDTHKCSFVHRRFAEFFVVDWFRVSDVQIACDAIPTDSRWRDCLVMYCGVAHLPERVRIAEYCWSVINSQAALLVAGNVSQARAAIHCVRFLADAFRSDRTALASFSGDLANVVFLLLSSEDLLAAKVGAELIPAINDDRRQQAIVRAFEVQSGWIRDTTLNACRHLAQFDSGTQDAIRQYVRGLPLSELIRRFHELRFSFGLSESLRQQRLSLELDYVQVLTLCCVLILMSVWIGSHSLIGLFMCYALIGFMILLLSIPAPERPFPRRQARRPFERLVLVVFGGERDKLYRCISISAGVLLFTLLLADTFAGAGWLGLKLEVAGLERPPSGMLAVIVPVVVICILGWDTPLRFWRFLRGPSRIKRLWDVVKALFLDMRAPLIALSCLGCLVLGYEWLDENASESIRRILHIALAVVQWGGGGVVALVFLFAVTLTGATLVRCAFERRRMRKAILPASIRCPEVYERALLYECSGVRREYLERLRLRKVAFVPPVTNPPDDLLLNRGVAEEVSRLREQWYGLEG